MAKQQVNALKKNSSPATRRKPAAKPRSRPRSAARVAATRKGTKKRAPKSAPSRPPNSEVRKSALPSGETQFRVHMASLLRLSENIVNRAVGAYDKLFALEPTDHAQIYLQMGRDLAQRGNLEEALEALRKAQRLSPSNVEIGIELGLLHMQREAPQAAVHALVEAKALGKPTYRLRKALAEAFIVMERYEEALDELEVLLRLEPGVSESYYQLGIALDRLGRFDEAIKAFEAAIELSPSEVVYHQSLGFTLESVGRRREAIKRFKRALELERTPAQRRRAVG